MINGKLSFTTRRQLFNGNIDLHVFEKRGDKVAVAQNITMQEIDPGEAPQTPLLSLRIEQAQSLMDELWYCGLRPSEGTGSAGSLAATERHLADMRRLVFKEDKPA